jgi:tRNA threonylcarbamoyladenosine biosynthesis protein TsaB
VILLALDTCDSQGSLAVLRDEVVLTVIAHEGTEEYSSWVLPTAEAVLRASGLELMEVDVFAVASGPGSFTGVRIGLTTVKAWSEAFGKGIASVSRLEAMAAQAAEGSQYVAAFADARRDQVFGGLYRREGARLRLVEHEMVAAPTEFADWVNERSANRSVSWISADPDKVTALEAWQKLANEGHRIELSSSVLAPMIGKIGLQRAREGRLVDALALDAEYIRRPDAESFWKGATGRGC